MGLFDEKNSTFEEAYQKALNLLNYAPQTEKMLTQKLIKKKYTKKIIEEVLDRLKKNNLLNELEYAKIYADNLAKIKCMGKTKIFTKLIQKGIGKDDASILAENSINECGGEEEIIKKYIKKNIAQITRLLETDKLEKIKIKLFNNGFSFSLINKMSNNLQELMKEL